MDEKPRDDDGWQKPPIYYPPVQTYNYMPEPINPVHELIRAMKSLLWSSGFLTYIIMLIISVILLFAITPAIQGWITTPSADTGELPTEMIFLILPVPVGLFLLSGLSFQIWHLIVLAILGSSFFYAVYDLYRSWSKKDNSALISITTPEKAKSGLEGVGKLFMATAFFSLVYFVLIEAGGVVTETPGFEELASIELLYRLFSAAVFEELVSRILLIGFPLLMIALIMKWKPPYSKLLIGGGMRLNIITLLLILSSSLIFAFAHVQSWDFWKVPQVFVSGMALGYAFVAYGVYASILLHFSVNFTSSVLITLWPDNFGLELGIGLIFLVWIVVGAFFFFDYLLRFSRRMMELMKIKTAPRPVQQGPGYGYPPQYPPPQAAPPYQTQTAYRGYVCPNCGNTNAGYKDGELVCMRCGHITR